MKNRIGTFSTKMLTVKRLDTGEYLRLSVSTRYNANQTAVVEFVYNYDWSKDPISIAKTLTRVHERINLAITHWNEEIARHRGRIAEYTKELNNPLVPPGGYHFHTVDQRNEWLISQIEIERGYIDVLDDILHCDLAAMEMTVEQTCTEVRKA